MPYTNPAPDIATWVPNNDDSIHDAREAQFERMRKAGAIKLCNEYKKVKDQRMPGKMPDGINTIMQCVDRYLGHLNYLWRELWKATSEQEGQNEFRNAINQLDRHIPS